jgi:hypothetical protein
MFFPQCQGLRFKLCKSIGLNKGCPVTMEWRVFWLRMEKRPPPRRVAVNILNKQLRTTDKGWKSTLEVGRGAKTHHPRNVPCYKLFQNSLVEMTDA